MKILPMPTFGFETKRRFENIEPSYKLNYSWRRCKANNMIKVLGYFPFIGGIYAGCSSIHGGFQICIDYDICPKMVLTARARVIRGLAEIYGLGPILFIIDVAKFIIEEIALCIKKMRSAQDIKLQSL